MRVLVQRVKYASCVVDNKEVSSIKEGLLVFFGACTTDSDKELEYCAKKLANLRVFSDEFGKMNKSIIDMDYEILSISQFTLYGDVSNGYRPSFTKALEPNSAKELYHKFTNILIKEYNINTYEGIFGADMKINLLNDGPVTILIER